MCRLKLCCFDKASLSQTGLCKGGLADWSELRKESLLNCRSPSRETFPSAAASLFHRGAWTLSRPLISATTCMTWLAPSAALPAVRCPTLCSVVRRITQRDRPALEINCSSHRGFQPWNTTKHETCAELPGKKIRNLAWFRVADTYQLLSWTEVRPLDVWLPRALYWFFIVSGLFSVLMCCNSPSNLARNTAL